MRGILLDNNRFIEKDLFRFQMGCPVLYPVFGNIALTPFKSS